MVIGAPGRRVNRIIRQVHCGTGLRGHSRDLVSRLNGIAVESPSCLACLESGVERCVYSINIISRSTPRIGIATSLRLLLTRLAEVVTR